MTAEFLFHGEDAWLDRYLEEGEPPLQEGIIRSTLIAAGGLRVDFSTPRGRFACMT